MAIGVSYELFWHLNPRKLESFTKAFKLKQEMIDEQMWIQGAYVQNAFGVVLSNAFGGKTSKKQEYLKQPFSKSQSNKELTKEQKQNQVEQLFTMLNVRKANFDIEKKKKLEKEGNT